MSETDKAADRPTATLEEDPNAAIVCSSPPCFMHELDPSYLGYLRQEEVAALLAAVLAADWRGDVPDEPRLRAALRRRLEALGGPQGDRDAPPGGAPDAPAPAIREALPHIGDDALRRDLAEVLGALERGGPHPERLAREG